MKENVRLFLTAIQLVLFITAIVLLAMNRHESFQDWMLFTLFFGYLAGFHYKEK